MDIIHLCMKKRGIRFLYNVKKIIPNYLGELEYINLGTKGDFLRLLNQRKTDYDIVLVTAHGANHCILTTTSDLNEPFKSYIDKSETTGFENDFIFAFSCDTANEFGLESIKNGALAYIGYEVKISSIFNVTSDEVPKRIRKSLNVILKRIIVEELSKSLTKFAKTPMSAETLRQHFAFQVEKRLYELQDMNVQEIFQVYGVKIDKYLYRKYFAQIMINQLKDIDEINRHLVCLGDKNYFYHGFIGEMIKNGKNDSEINQLINKKNMLEKLENVKYKDYINCCMREYPPNI